MNRPLICRTLCEADVATVADFDRRYLGGMWSEEGYQRELTSPNSEILLLATPPSTFSNAGETRPGETIAAWGSFWAILDEAHVTLLGVVPEYRQQGLGQLLLASLLQRAIARKLRRATLEVRKSNQAARSLYAKFGFRPVGERPNYYRNPPEAATILWRNKLQTSTTAVAIANLWERGRDRAYQCGWQLID
ncbi:ribosomal protein S18-alanine N-acetyltransferase [Rubidibacter lacunae]|uniref:ribosomal protein S18-alanine N-acetyltransferase n=1 Tax=Rubidibacter lacunae TaxID=582514 RepID=UPI0008FEF145|nr:ribosomal protein S18-alanine N-acetyltransferase [Rubidibacter lacunae]